MSPSRSVLFVAEGGDSSCAYYRAHLPAKGLREHGLDCEVSAVCSENDNGMISAIGSPFPDVVITRRMQDVHGNPISSADMFHAAREAGQLVYVDLDDDPWNLPEWNPAYHTDWQAKLPSWVADMEAATGVIVSTPALAESVQEHTEVTNVHVCRNGVDPTGYNAVRQWPHYPLRLGWCGLVSYRGDDLRTIKDALWELFSIEAVRDDVDFWHLGARPEEESVLSILGHDFPGNVVEVPWVPVESFPKALEEIDVAVIPQIPGKFADARSDATGLAMAAAGVPFAATMTAEYRHLWVKGVAYPFPDASHSHTMSAHKFLGDPLQTLTVLTAPEFAGARSDLRTAGLQYVKQRTPQMTALDYLTAFAKDNANG